MNTPTGPSPVRVPRTLLPWEMAIHAPIENRHPGFDLGLAMTAGAATMMGARMPRERIHAIPVVHKEDQKTKRRNKAQRDALAEPDSFSRRNL